MWPKLLFFSPPGTGKTMLAKGMQNRVWSSFIYIDHIYLFLSPLCGSDIHMPMLTHKFISFFNIYLLTLIYIYLFKPLPKSHMPHLLMFNYQQL